MISEDTKQAMSAMIDVWSELDRIREESMPVASRPKDSFTIGEYSERYGLPASTATRQVGRLVKQGKLASCRAMVPDSLGRMVATTVYEVL